MKYLLFSLLLIAVPTVAIADNMPVNYMILRGRIFSLDHLWGRSSATAKQVAAPTQASVQPMGSREMRDYNQRIEFENARRQILIEGIDNGIR